MARLSRSIFPFALFMAVQSVASAGLKDHPGRWMGELAFPDGTKLKSGVDIFARADGSWWAAVTSPDQGAYDIPVTSITEHGDSAHLDLKFATLKLTWKGDRFVGEWTQAGETFPVQSMQAVAEFPAKVRPQTPAAPFPYAEESVVIPAAKGVTLSGTLSLPTAASHPTLVILVHGSGPHTRDEHMAGHRPFAVLADHLARQGVAVLRYDKRGIMRSTGDYYGHTQADLAGDVQAAVRAMRARGQFARIGLVGHSEGPMIAADVASREGQPVDFLVSLAGVGLKGRDLIVLQDRLLAQDRGASAAEQDRIARYASRFYAIVMAHPASGPRLAALKAMRRALPAAERKLIDKYKMNEGSLSMEMAAQPALRTILMADPEQAWRKVKVPVLALNGSVDRQVPPQSMTAIVKALASGGNKQVESEVLPSINHALQTSATGAEAEYAEIAETVAPVVLQRVSDFVRKQR